MPLILGILTLVVIGGFFVYVQYRKNMILGILLGVSLTLRLIAAFVQDIYQIAPYVWDEALFINMGIKVQHFLDGSRLSLPFKTLAGVSAYGSVLGSLFYLYGMDTILPRILNALFGTSVVFLTWKLSETIGLKTRYCLVMALIVGLTPSYILYSALIMRDMLIWLLLLVLMYLWVISLRDLNLRYFGAAFIPAVFLVSLRPQYAPIFALMIGFIAFGFARRLRFQWKRINLPGIQYILFSFFLSFILVGGFFLILTEIARWENTNVLDYLVSQLNWRIQGGSAYLVDQEFTSLWDVVRFLPLRIIHFTFGPFFWTSSSPQIIASAVEALVGSVFFLLLVFYLPTLFKSVDINRPCIIFLLVFALINIVAASIIDSNYGTAMRHRMVFMPFIFISVLWLRQQWIILKQPGRQPTVKETVGHEA